MSRAHALWPGRATTSSTLVATSARFFKNATWAVRLLRSFTTSVSGAVTSVSPCCLAQSLASWWYSRALSATFSGTTVGSVCGWANAMRASFRSTCRAGISRSLIAVPRSAVALSGCPTGASNWMNSCVGRSASVAIRRTCRRCSSLSVDSSSAAVCASFFSCATRAETSGAGVEVSGGNCATAVVSTPRVRDGGHQVVGISEGTGVAAEQVVHHPPGSAEGLRRDAMPVGHRHADVLEQTRLEVFRPTRDMLEPVFEICAVSLAHVVEPVLEVEPLGDRQLLVQRVETLSGGRSQPVVPGPESLTFLELGFPERSGGDVGDHVTIGLFERHEQLGGQPRRRNHGVRGDANSRLAGPEAGVRPAEVWFGLQIGVGVTVRNADRGQ